MRRDDAPGRKTQSQSVSTNISRDGATVQKLLAGKGAADIISIRPDDTLATAVGLLRDKRIGALVVTGADGTLAGILSERDIVRKLAETPGQTLPQTVGDNMTCAVETCAPNDLLVDVLRRMTGGRFRHMPVVDQGKLCGMVTIGDVVHYRLNELEHETLQLKQIIVG